MLKTLWRIARAVLSAAMVAAALAVCWTAAYYATSYVYSRLGARPAELVVQVVNSMLGFLLFVGVMAIISHLTLPRRMAMFHTIIDAMSRLSRGDFNVVLHLKTPADNQFGELVRSFNDMAAKLGAMEKMRQEFISNVSHEIQSPLTSIGGFARALRNPGLSGEERLHYLDIIETETQRLSRLSDNLLKLTALESEHPPFERRRYRLDRQLREAVLALEPQWLNKSIDMDVSLAEAEIVADPELMNQVWLNLLQNSIKFTPPGGTVGVHLALENGEAAVRIRDTGIGIGEEDLPRIFERFYKADKARDRSLGGSGLGLSIAKKIVDMHRGTIEVRSRLGEGSEFTVRLPADARDEAPGASSAR